MKLTHFGARTVFRYSSAEHVFRGFRLFWERGIVGDGLGFSAKLSFAFVPAWFRFNRAGYEWQVTLCGFRIHYCRAYGGIYS